MAVRAEKSGGIRGLVRAAAGSFLEFGVADRAIRLAGRATACIEPRPANSRKQRVAWVLEAGITLQFFGDWVAGGLSESQVLPYRRRVLSDPKGGNVDYLPTPRRGKSGIEWEFGFAQNDRTFFDDDDNLRLVHFAHVLGTLRPILRDGRNCCHPAELDLNPGGANITVLLRVRQDDLGPHTTTTVPSDSSVAEGYVT